jgi:PAS domain S-box-containing protein
MTEPDLPGISASSEEIDPRSISAARAYSRPWGLFAGCVALCLLLVAFAEYLIREGRRAEIASQGDRLEAVALLKASMVRSWLAGLIADAVISGKGVGATMGPLWTAPPDSPELAALGERLDLLRRAMGYESVRVVDLEGRVALAAPTGDDRLPFALPPPASDGRPRFVWRPNGESARALSFALVSPMAPSGSDVPKGWLVVTTEPSVFLGPLLAEWPGESDTAQTFLMRTENDHVWFYDSRRPDGAAAAPLGATADPFAALALRGQTGRVEVVDDAGDKVLAHLVPIAGVPWVLGTRIDRAELYGKLAARERFIRGGLLAAVVLALLFGGLALRRNRRRLEARATRANQRFRAIFANADEGVLLLDSKARLLDVNPAARALLRLEGTTRSDMTLADLVAPDDLAAQPLKFTELAERGTVRTERKLLRGGSEVFPAAVHSIRLADGRSLAFVRDLSDLRRAEERERRVKRMARFGTWDWDPRTEVMHWDDETFLVLGYDPAKDVASREAWFERVHPDDRERVAEAVRLALADETVFDFECRLALPEGKERYVRVVADIVRSATGTAQRVDGAVQDLTARRLADERLAAAQQQLAESQKTEAVGRLAGSIAHDFNNVVGVISGFAELAELELGEAHPTGPHLAEIRQAAGRAAELTRQLLAFARRKPAALRVVPFAEIVDDVRAPLRQLLGPEIEVEIAGDCEGASLRVDPAQIAQVLLNLAVNARDAMPNGGRFTMRWRRVVLEPGVVNRRPPLRTGRCLELTIEDTGTGMDAATAARCFEPFFTTKGQGVGTGLGLSSVKSVLDSCGAAIGVESEVGRGARFTIWFPVALEERERVSEADAAVRLGRDEHVLVVDDVAPMREMVGNILRRAGFRVTLSADARSALECLTSTGESFDLLLTDVVMPQVSGRDLAAKALVAKPELRILFMTGHAGLQPDGMPFELPENLLIEKPFSGAELVRRIRASLDAPPERAELEN